jgi:amidophosphoribosyltransferase
MPNASSFGPSRAQSIRDFGVKIKHNPIRGQLEGKRVVLVDDSIVRGTSMLKISNMMRSSGAREVHVRISAPPTIRPCHYGIDMPTREELIAANNSLDEIRDAIGADTLGYHSVETLRRTGVQLKHGLCDACFSDEYPVPVNEENGIPQLSLFRAVGEEGEPGGRE